MRQERIYLLALVVGLAIAPGVGAQVAGHWRLDGRGGVAAEDDPPISVAAPKASSVQVHQGWRGLLAYSGDLPGAFIYDPATGRSVENRGSLLLHSEGYDSDYLEFALAAPGRTAKGGLTVELFAKGGDQGNLPNEVVPVLRQTRRNQEAAAFEFVASRPPTLKGFSWWQAGVTAGNSETVILARQAQGTVTQMDANTWRHLALVYDPTQRTASFYCDYTLIGRRWVGELVWDDGPLLVGGQPDGKGFRGLVDELRVTRAALKPHQFLRASQNSLRKVSFEVRDGRVPRAMGYVNVRQRFGAVGDGKTDDTAALQRAATQLSNANPYAYPTMYLPNGTYLVSDTIEWWRYLTLQGESREGTIIKLRDNCQGYDSTRTPKAVVATGQGIYPRNRRHMTGSGVANYVFDLTIDTGKGNPSAYGLDFQSGDPGAAENVTVQSGDGTGKTGLALRRAPAGAALLRNISVTGFDCGVEVLNREYGLTFVNLTLRGQHEVGLRNTGNAISVEGLTSHNRVPAVVNGTGGLAVLLNARLTGGAPEAPAIDNSGALYARNVVSQGYAAAIKDKGETVAGKEQEEYFSIEPRRLFDAPKKAVHLPFPPAPTVPWGNPEKDWVNIRDFGNLVVDNDWAPAIQAAIDTEKPTVYFPAGRYAVASTVYVRGKVQRLFGAGRLASTVLFAKELPKGQPTMRIEGGKGPLIVERLKLDVVEHASARSLVLRYADVTTPSSAPGSGPLFLEGARGQWRFRRGQRVVARQLALLPMAEAGIVNDGADVWVLGLHNKGPNTTLASRNGARTEVLGGLLFLFTKAPGPPLFDITDSQLGLMHNLSWRKALPEVYLRCARGAERKELPGTIIGKTVPANCFYIGPPPPYPPR